MITNHNFELSISSDKTGRTNYSHVIDGFTITKSLNDVRGSLNLSLSTKYANDFKSISSNDFSRLKINERIKFEGLLVRPTISGQVESSGRAGKTIKINGYDAGHIFTHIAAPYLDLVEKKHLAFFCDAKSKFGSAYKDSRGIASYINNLYNVFFEGIFTLIGGEYLFADKEKFFDKSKFNKDVALLLANDNSFYHQLPSQINFMQNRQNFIDYAKQIADTNFHEVYGDCFNFGDRVHLGRTKSVITRDGYKIVIRPKPFNSTSNNTQYWDENQYYDIGSRHYQYGISMDASQVYTSFLVSNTGFNYNANKAITIGDIKIDNSNAKKFGYRLYKVDIKAFFNKSEKGFEAELKSLTNILADWYEYSPYYLYGQISFPYNDFAQIGKKIKFKLPDDDTQYEAYTEQLTTIFSQEENRLYQVATVTRGREVKE